MKSVGCCLRTWTQDGYLAGLAGWPGCWFLVPSELLVSLWFSTVWTGVGIRPTDGLVLLWSRLWTSYALWIHVLWVIVHAIPVYPPKHINDFAVLCLWLYDRLSYDYRMWSICLIFLGCFTNTRAICPRPSAVILKYVGIWCFCYAVSTLGKVNVSHQGLTVFVMKKIFGCSYFYCM